VDQALQRINRLIDVDPLESLLINKRTQEKTNLDLAIDFHGPLRIVALMPGPNSSPAQGRISLPSLAKRLRERRSSLIQAAATPDAKSLALARAAIQQEMRQALGPRFESMTLDERKRWLTARLAIWEAQWQKSAPISTGVGIDSFCELLEAAPPVLRWEKSWSDDDEFRMTAEFGHEKSR